MRRIFPIVDEYSPGDLMCDLYMAYLDARKNKRRTKSQILFEMHLEDNLMELYRDLYTGKYKVGRYMCFIIEDPVKREVFAATFRDRVVHHLVYNCIKPVLDRKFIYDSYSCREGKGVLMGIERLDHHIRSCSDNYRKETWVLKMDIRGYFMSIDKELLYARVQKMLLGEDYPHRELVAELLRKIIFSDPTKGCYRKGSLEDWKGLPPSKSLFTAKEGCGLPIGNLTSQLFSNVYLSALDDYVKRELKFKHYGRYVDDFYIVCHDRERLRDAVGKIRDFLWNELGLVLHPQKTYLQKICNGVPFLGALVKPYRIYVSNRTRNRFYGRFSDVMHLDDAFSSLNSYLGYLGHFKSYGLRRNFAVSHPWIWMYGTYENGFGKYTLFQRQTCLHDIDFTAVSDFQDRVDVIRDQQVNNVFSSSANN